MYIDCPACGEPEGVEVRAHVEKVHAYEVDDIETLLCIACGADPDYWLTRKNLRQTIIAHCEEIADGY